MSKRQRSTQQPSAAYCSQSFRRIWRTLMVALLVSGGMFAPRAIRFGSGVANAQTSPVPGSIIENQAAGSFFDPTDSSTQVVESNIVQVTVAEVAGITVTASGSIDDGEVNPNDVITFDFTITNVGNDPTQFFIPGSPSAVSNGSAGTLQIVAYDPDGSGATVASQTVNINVPAGGINTGDVTDALGLPNGAIPPGGTVTVRVPVTVDSGAIAGSVVSVTLGETTPDGGGSTQNQPYVAGTSDVYTQDNQDTDAVDSSLTAATETEAAGVLAVSAEREASASQDSRAIAAASTLPPNDTSALFCPAPPPETPYTDYRIAWTYNSPNNTLLPDHQPWPNSQFDATQIASAPAQVIGPGMSHTFDSDKQTVIHLSQVDQIDAASAYVAEDYIEYQFTTDSGMDLERLMNGLAIARHDYTQNYDIAIQLSKDNFATVTTLLSDYTVTTAAGAYEWTPLPLDTALHLTPNTTYKFRILFYNATDADAVYWDDFHLSMGGCQDFSDAPATAYGAASHGLPPVPSHYLGNASPDAEAGVRDGGNGGVSADGDDTGGNTPDDEEGITLPSLQQGKTANVNIQVAGTGGYLQAWIDWDGDGNFTTAEDQVALNVQDGGGDDIDGSTDGNIRLSVNVPADATTSTTYVRFRWATSQNLDATTYASDGEVEDYALAIATASDPNILLVKRITAINNNTLENPNDNTPLNTVLNDGTPDSPDDHANWPASYLVGALDGGSVRPVSSEPADTVEYSIYFLSTGEVEAKDVLLCDRVPTYTTFLPNAYASTPADPTGTQPNQLGINVDFNGNNYGLTGASDGDAGYYFPAGLEPSTQFPNINCGGTNDNGAVVVNLGNLPPATSPGNPTDSFGVLRFQAQIN